MLIYNFQKEFLGIDAKDLQELGYHDLSSLRSEVTDFADLFVKTPGYIHNFQHVHWIDFIDCADDGEIQKVIINANGKNFTANLLITYAYLSDNPIEKAYLIHLNNLRVLSNGEVEHIHDDILQKSTPIHNKPIVEPEYTTIEPVHETEQILTPEIGETPVQDILPAEGESNNIDEFIPQVQESVQENVQEVPAVEDVYDTNDIKLDIDFKEEPLANVTPPTKIAKKEKFDNGSIYDPEVASKELGLPLDLIEEFIQDFIEQAEDFKPELYSSLNDGDIDNVKTLSHKLKGVAANLRIEDAFEVLALINTTPDISVIQTNLDLFYKIIAKLAGEEIDEVVTVAEEPIQKQKQNQVQEEKQEEFSLEFKDDVNDLIEEPIEIQEQEQEEKENQEELSLTFKDESQEIIPKTTPEITQETIEINYSKEKVANEIGLDIESFKELFSDYIHETNILIKEMQNAAESNNFELVNFEVMKLQGMSENMRINSFNSELKALTHSTNQDESLKLIHKIQNIEDQLSKVGA